jgi:hypothetical protein
MPSPEASISAPNEEDGVALADWAEAIVLLEQRERVSRATLRGRLSLAGPSDDASLGLLFAEMRRRKRLAPRTYPFRVEDSGVVLIKSVNPRLYELLLLLALDDAYFRYKGQWARASMILEAIAKRALGAYWGASCRVVQFGWPSSDGRPKDFPTAVSWLAQAMGLPEGSQERSPHTKDAGVDVVAWAPFVDQQPAMTVLLGQVTVGTESLAEKGQGVAVHQWNSWIPFGVPPATAFIVPFVLGVSDTLWNDLKFRTNLVLDRMRLSALLRTSDVAGVLRESHVQAFLDRERRHLVI